MKGFDEKTMKKIFEKHLEEHPEVLERLNTLSEEDERELFPEKFKNEKKDKNVSEPKAK